MKHLPRESGFWVMRQYRKSLNDTMPSGVYRHCAATFDGVFVSMTWSNYSSSVWNKSMEMTVQDLVFLRTTTRTALFTEFITAG